MTDTWWLETARHERRTAHEAARLLDDEGAIGFLYTPESARFVARRGGTWTVHSPERGTEAADLDAAFELVLFTPERQLRWLHEGSGLGTPIMLSEKQAGRGDPREPHRSPAQAGGGLLWGRVNRQAGDELWLSAEGARVWAISVPFDSTPVTSVADGAQLRLEHVEYLQEDDQGNVSVVDIRYTRISVAEA